MKQNNTFINFCKINIPEILAFALFCIGTITISFFHEPWFDEFQAYGIAKTNLYDILFVIPHMEGHPPLWHLILKSFQQFITNPELVLKIPNLTIMFMAIGLLLFKSPFPRPVKLFLPFTYFLFYQYSIISRPYSLLILALFLAATLYKTKNEHPFKFISVLALLAMTSAYGMVLATAITFAWLIEISGNTNILNFLKSFFKDKRFFAMLILFFVCLGLAIEIFPNKDITAATAFKETFFLPKFFSIFCCFLSDVLFTNFFNYITYRQDSIVNISFFLTTSLGIFLNILFYKIFKEKNNLPIFLLPYLSFLTFCFFVYISPHHLGILFGCIIFSFWCLLQENQNPTNDKYTGFLKIIITISILTQIYWAVFATTNDIKLPYSTGREFSNFIKKNSLTKYKIMNAWQYRTIYYSKKGTELLDIKPNSPLLKEEPFFSEEEENYNMQHISIVVNPYFAKSIFFNNPIFTTEKPYTIHKKLTNKEKGEIKQLWANNGIPDIIIGNANIPSIYGKDFNIIGNYIQIKSVESGFCWKDRYYTNTQKMYVHKNLYDKMKDFTKNEK